VTPSTTTYNPGDLLLVTYPYTDMGQTKKRPALVLVDTGDADILLARLTSQTHSTPFDVALQDWRGSGLLGPSTVRLHKLATIEKTSIIRLLGNLLPADRQRVSAVLRQTYGNW
jgi:mRNA interferase MazF